MSLETQAIEQLLDNTKPWPPEWGEKEPPRDELMWVFLGVWDWCEQPSILRDNGLLSEAEFELICDKLDHAQKTDTDPWRVARPFVKQAYLKFVAHADH